MKHYNALLASFALTLSAALIPAQYSAGQSLADYNSLPETIAPAEVSLPNVLIVLDNSGSMRARTGNNLYVGASHPNSRSYLARKVLRDIIADPENFEAINIGFIEYDMEWSELTGNANEVAIEDCGDLTPPEYTVNIDPTTGGQSTTNPTLDPVGHTATDIIPCTTTNDSNASSPTFYNLWRSNSFNSGRGRLRENISILDAAKIARLNKIMAIEPQQPDLYCLKSNGTCNDKYDEDDSSNFNPTTSTDEDDRQRRWAANKYGVGDYIINPTDNNGNGIPDMVEDPESPSFSTRGTPTFGALVAAQNLFRNKFVTTNTADAANGYFATLLPANEVPVAPASSSVINAGQCNSTDYILLITDGEPFNDLIGDTAQSKVETCVTNMPGCIITGTDTGGSARRLIHTEASIAPLLRGMHQGTYLPITPDESADNNYTVGTPVTGYNSIKTLVFGFGNITTNIENVMNTMARGGADDNNATAYISSSADVLKSQLQTVISEINLNSASSSGVSVVASSSDAAGSIVQAVYNPEITETVVDPADATSTITLGTVSWVSRLSAYFIDEYGFLREDNQALGQQGALDDYTIDRAFELDFDDVDQNVFARKFTPQNLEGDGGSFNKNYDAEIFEVTDLTPIWEAGSLLNQSVTDDGYPTNTNRPYDEVASSTGFRHIFSWIENTPGTGDFDTGTKIDFTYSATTTADSINPNNYTLLSTALPADAENIINFIRGDESLAAAVGFRNRTIVDTTVSPNVSTSYLLGDIVHSTAIQLDAPSENFSTQFSDSSYSAFETAYKDRRRMVYVGSNGGLLHGFNGGFWDGENSEFHTTATSRSTDCINCDDVDHKLGVEMWAYAPMNLLPHLQFLTQTAYGSGVHVNYMDGPIQTYDVKAFEPSTKHVNGWGTILVAGMRLGGGDFPNVNYDATDTTKTFTTRSAYVILDVTDPREAPEVIAEITDDELGFTTSSPTVMKEGENWYLVFGSGPNQLSDVTSVPEDLTPAIAREPHFYKYLLNVNDGATRALTKYDIPTVDSAFAGDMASHDWDSDYSDDAVYFGVVAGDEVTPDGGVFRYNSANDSVDLLLDVQQPVPYKPLLKTSAGKDWAFFGTGRYFTSADTKNITQNSFYGVMEERDTDTNNQYPTVSPTDILDTETDVEIDGTLSPAIGALSTFDELRTEILTNPNIKGWKTDYDVVSPSAKNTTTPLSFRDFVFHAHYEPPNSSTACNAIVGTSYLNVVNLVTGTASFTEDFDGPIGVDADDANLIASTTEIGDGYTVSIELITYKSPETGETEKAVLESNDTSLINKTVFNLPPSPSGRTSWRELEIQ